MGELIWGVEGIDVDDDAPRDQGAEEGNDLLRGVREHHGDPLAGLQAELLEPSGESAGELPERGVGEGEPEELEGGTLGKTGCALGEKAPERFRGEVEGMGNPGIVVGKPRRFDG
jgi:hypothetical protein